MAEIPDCKFSVVGKDGRTYWANPKLEAYRQMAWLQAQGRITSLTVVVNTAGQAEYKVESSGLMTLIFCQAKE